MSVPNLDVAVPRDDLDDLLDADLGGDDAFRELDTNMDAPDLPPRSRPANTTADLGIDSEIKIAKQKRPVAKLDETRLLSANGIPKLRRITKDRLKFKGKGHEFSDVARLLNLYQLWLDDLFPKAKFADGLALIEKAGHSKRMQIMRREWIDEGKPRDQDEERRWEAVKAHDAKQQLNGASKVESKLQEAPVSTAKAAQSDVAMSGALSSEPHDESLFVSDDDGMDLSTPRLSKPSSAGAEIGANTPRPSTGDIRPSESLFFSDDEAPTVAAGEDLDDLDALLAEDEQRKNDSSTRAVLDRPQPQTRVPDEFDDEMEAMAGLDEW